MRKIERLLLAGCGYTVLILALFYLFAAISKFATSAIAPKQFFLIFAFGMIIAGAELLYEALKLKRILKALIHYFVLLLTFCVVFLISGNIAGDKSAAIFVAIIVFTIMYFFLLLVVTLIKRSVGIADDIVEKRQAKSKPKNEKEAYKPLYSSKDKD